MKINTLLCMTLGIILLSSCSPLFWQAFMPMSSSSASYYNSSYYGSASGSSWGSYQPWNTPTDVNKFAENQRNMTPSFNSNGSVYYSGSVSQTGTTASIGSSTSSTSTSTLGSSGNRKKDCHMCHGTGQCSSCNGSGVIYSFYGDKMDCPNCTNGKCKNCQ